MEIYIETLLRLMAGVEDTNILSRSDRQTLYYAQQAAPGHSTKGGAFTEEGLAAVWKLNDDFVARHISPGGCADLLIPIHLPLPYGVSFSRAVDLTGKLQPYELIPKEGGQLFWKNDLDRALIHAALTAACYGKTAKT